MNPFVKILSLSLIITLTSSLVVAQDLKLDWAKTAGKKGTTTISFSVAGDQNGNVFTTGVFTGTVDFDPGSGVINLSAIGSESTFIQKLDSNGNFIWAKMLGNSNGKTIDIDSHGNVLLTGGFNGVIDFDPGPSVYTMNSATGSTYVLKLDNAGNFKWAKNDFNWGFSIQADLYDNMVVLGYDTLTKLDSNGTVMWKINHDFNPRSLAIDDKGNIALTGYIVDTVDLDPGPSSHFVYGNTYWPNYAQDIAVVKYNSNGNYIWARTIHSGAIWSQSVTFDDAGNLLVAGVFSSWLGTDFDPGVGTYLLNGDTNDFVLKLDPNGIFKWAKTITHRKNNLLSYHRPYTHAHSICSDDKGNVYVYGDIGLGIFDMNPGVDSIIIANSLIHSTYQTSYLQVLDSNGNYLSHSIFNYTTSHGGWYYLGFNDIGGDHRMAYNNKSLLTTGEFGARGNYYFNDSVVDFDPSPLVYLDTAKGRIDAFVQKLSQCTYKINHYTDTIVACNSFTWIDSLTYSFGDSNLTYATGSNCMFNVHHLNLTIVEVDTIVTQIPGTYALRIEGSNSHFQWLDCDNAFQPIPNARGKTFNPAKNGNYAVEIRKNGCVDTSACISVLAAGIQSFGNEINASIYPNPTSVSISIDLKGQKNIAIRITDLNGRLHYHTNSFNEKVLMISTDFAPGLYFVEMSGENKIQREKLVVR